MKFHLYPGWSCSLYHTPPPLPFCSRCYAFKLNFICRQHFLLGVFCFFFFFLLLASKDEFFSCKDKANLDGILIFIVHHYLMMRNFGNFFHHFMIVSRDFRFLVYFILFHSMLIEIKHCSEFASNRF